MTNILKLSQDRFFFLVFFCLLLLQMSGKTERATYKVYVGNLGNNGSKKELEREFERFEKLHDVWVARNPPGFAFVEFVEYRDAEDACRSLDGARNYILCLSILHIDHFVHLQKVIFTVI